MLNPFKKSLRKTWKSIKNAPAIKGHLDFIAVIVSIILSSLILFQTVRNLHSNQPQPTPTPVLTQTKIIVATPTPFTQIITSRPTRSPQTCQKGLALTTIDSPIENDTISNNPVCITINYHQGDYCSAVWAYQINGGQWSNFGTDSPCFYNLPTGQDTVNVQVKSLVTSDTQTLSRDFIYQSSTASPSATTQQ